MNRKEFMNEVRPYCDVAIERSNKFLKGLGLSLSINWDYDFNDLRDDAIGVYERWSVLEDGEIWIGCNMEKLYSFCMENIELYPTSDPYRLIDETIQTTIFHEMGHGLVDLFSHYLNDTDDLDDLYDGNHELFDWILDNEEDAVEEFAWDFYDNDVGSSRLGKLVGLLRGMWNKGDVDKLEESLDKVKSLIMRMDKL